MARLWIPFLPYALISAVHVGLRLAEHPLDYLTKLLLMPALALAALWVMLRVRPVPRGATIVLLLSIVCSWLGDGAAFFFSGLPELPMMLLSFGLAHLGYVFLIWKVPGIARGGFPRWSWIYVGAYLALVVTLWPHAGSLLVPVMIYGLLLTATAAFAARCAPVIAWGGAWFLVSDAILAFRIFVPEAMPDWTSGAVMLTYTLGQGLLVYGIVSALRARANFGKVTPGGVAEASVGSAG
jgi:hypothetical protein